MGQKEQLRKAFDKWGLTWLKNWKRVLILVAAGLIIGVLAALAEVVFFYGLRFSIRSKEWLGNWSFLLMPFLGLLVVWIFQRFGGPCSKGMNLVFEVARGKFHEIPLKNLGLAMVGTWLSHLAGASVGREGVALQLGATVSNFLERFFPKMERKKTIFIVTGMAAGFAGLFGTPFTATFFALEVFRTGSVQLVAMLPALTAAFTASSVSHLFGIVKEAMPLDFSLLAPNGISWWQIIIFGVIFGLIGGLFAQCIHLAKHSFAKWFKNPYLRVAVIGTILAVLMALFHGRYSNLGGNLIEPAVEGGVIHWYDWILKFAFSICFLSCGFMGGEVTPLFTTGACLGCVMAPLMGLDPTIGAALGYAAVFGAGTNTLVAPILIGMEIFGWSTFPVMFLVCIIGYIFNGNQSIYELQTIVPDEGA